MNATFTTICFLLQFLACINAFLVRNAGQHGSPPPIDTSDDFWLSTIAASATDHAVGNKAMMMAATLEVTLQTIRTHGRVCQPREITLPRNNSVSDSDSEGDDGTWHVDPLTDALSKVRRPSASTSTIAPLPQRLNTTRCVYSDTNVTTNIQSETDWNYCDISWAHSLAFNNMTRSVSSGTCFKSVDCHVNVTTTFAQNFSMGKDEEAMAELSLDVQNVVENRTDGVGSTKIGGFMRQIDLRTECKTVLEKTGAKEVTTTHEIILTDESCLVPPELTVRYRVTCTNVSTDDKKYNKSVAVAWPVSSSNLAATNASSKFYLSGCEILAVACLSLLALFFA